MLHELTINVEGRGTFQRYVKPLFTPKPHQNLNQTKLSEAVMVNLKLYTLGAHTLKG